MPFLRSRPALTAALATLVAACGSDADDRAGDASAAGGETAMAEFAGPLTRTPTSMPLVVADIDRWESGMDAELDAVRAAAQRLRQATSAGDSAMAIVAMNDASTRAAGASGAGVEEDRYQFIRETLSAAVSHLVPLEETMDVSAMPASMREEMQKNREAALANMRATIPPELMEALRTRAKALRAQELALAGERLKSAGLGR